MNHREKGKPLKMDLALSGADPNDYDGLLLPGGVANPDELRTNPQPVKLPDDSIMLEFATVRRVAALEETP
jgi:putative intracellular protease/amidase